MPKDIRKLAKDFREEPLELSANHEEKFLQKLQQELPRKKHTYQKWYIAASIAMLLGLCGTLYKLQETTGGKEPVKTTTSEQVVTIEDISPEMKKIENYYLTAINYEIASLEVTPENKALLDEYLEKVSKLDADYKRLHQQFQKEEISDKTINALITNLQLRLQLLIQLKDQLNDLQSKKRNHENTII